MTSMLRPGDWTDVASLIGVLTIPLGVVWGYLKFRLERLFTSRAAHASLGGRVEDVETRVRVVEAGIANVPTVTHVAKIADRVTDLEVAMERLGGDVRGIREGIARVERMVELLVKNELDEGRQRS